MIEVDAAPCKKRGATGKPHELVNDENGRTRCKHCSTSWAALDAQLRRALPEVTAKEKGEGAA